MKIVLLVRDVNIRKKGKEAKKITIYGNGKVVNQVVCDFLRFNEGRRILVPGFL